MKYFSSIMAFAALAAVTLELLPAEPPSGQKAERIGVYDSRSVAVAFAGSDAHKQWMAPLVEEHKKAKAAGDTKRVKELEAEGKTRQQRAHTQAFATAPVDDILKHIESELPQIKSRAGVTVLISKWDKQALAKHRSAEQVDVTLALVDAFNPSEKQRKSAIEIQKHKPISTRNAERIDD